MLFLFTLLMSSHSENFKQSAVSFARNVELFVTYEGVLQTSDYVGLYMLHLLIVVV